MLLKWGTLCCESEMCLRTVRGYRVCLLPDSVDKGHPSELSIQKWSGYTSIRPLKHQRNITSYFRNLNVNSFKLALFSNNSNYRTDLRHCPDTDDTGIQTTPLCRVYLNTWCCQCSLRSAHWSAYVTLPNHAQCGAWLCDLQGSSVAVVITHSEGGV